jgi:hypothetical protein
VTAASRHLGKRTKQATLLLPPAPPSRKASPGIAMVEKGSVILRRIWSKLYKPALDDLFRAAASKNVFLTPDAALEVMEQAFKSVFFLVEEQAGSTSKKSLPSAPRLYFRFDRIAFRREAHHYAVDSFYKTYFARGHTMLPSARKILHGRRGRPVSKAGSGLLSQPRMIREILRKRGEPLHADKIAQAIEKKFKVRLKRADITSVIYRAIRGNKFFRKEGVNTFGLVEWPVRHTGRFSQYTLPGHKRVGA